MKIYNVKIKTMSDLQIENGWIEIHNGKIANIGEGHPSSISEKDIDGKGQLLIPGFVDAHTHLGIIENAISFEGDDCNEASDPFTPMFVLSMVLILLIFALRRHIKEALLPL